MAKKESSLLQLIVSLTGISLAAALALSGVFLATKEPIETIKIKKNNDAKVAVLPGFNLETGTLVEETVKLDGFSDPFTVSLAYSNDELFGAAVATYTNIAFSGRFDIIVGFDIDGNILNTAVLEHHETPGLGDKINKKKNAFAFQFDGKNPSINKIKVKKDGGEIDAITAATISSRAFCDAVNNAYNAFQMVINNLNDTEKEENHE